MTTEERLATLERHATAMRRRAPSVVIGILIGIIVMQWAMPAAQSQTYSPWNASQFVLRDDRGDVSAILFNGENGPVLGIGTETEAQIVLAVHTASRRAQIFMNGGGITEGKVELNIDTHSVSGRETPRMQIFRRDPIESAQMSLSFTGGGGGGQVTIWGESAGLHIYSTLGGQIDMEANNDDSQIIEMRNHRGTTALLPALTGDLNFDRVVDLNDFFIFSDNFGNRASAKPLAKAVSAELPASETWDIAAEYRQKLESLR